MKKWTRGLNDCLKPTGSWLWPCDKGQSQRWGPSLHDHCPARFKQSFNNFFQASQCIRLAFFFLEKAWWVTEWRSGVEVLKGCLENRVGRSCGHLIKDGAEGEVPYCMTTALQGLNSRLITFPGVAMFMVGILLYVIEKAWWVREWKSGDEVLNGRLENPLGLLWLGNEIGDDSCPQASSPKVKLPAVLNSCHICRNKIGMQLMGNVMPCKYFNKMCVFGTTQMHCFFKGSGHYW